LIKGSNDIKKKGMQVHKVDAVVQPSRGTIIYEVSGQSISKLYMWMGWVGQKEAKNEKKKSCEESQKETTWTTRISSITPTEETSIDNNGQ